VVVKYRAPFSRGMQTSMKCFFAGKATQTCRKIVSPPIYVPQAYPLGFSQSQGLPGTLRRR
jgi:hypothetical protein